MPGRLLEPAERQRFIQYCREEAGSLDAIATAMDAMPHLEAVARHNRNRALAYAIVANDLEAVEDMAVSG